MSGMTRGQQAARLVSQIRGMMHDDARMLINQAYVACCEDHGWFHLLKRFTLQTEAKYNLGTVNVTNGSPTVTLNNDGTSAWVASWATAPSMRRITIAGRNEPYDVTTIAQIAGVWTITMADNWIGSNNATASYNLYRDTYALPADCGMFKMLSLFDPQLLFRLLNYAQPKFLAVRSVSPWLCMIPECFTVVNQTSESPPRPQIQFYPAPSEVRAYHGWYFRRPAFPTTDAEYLDWPTEFDDMIWTRAIVDHYAMPSTYSPKYLAEWKPRYADLYRKMKSQMDGQSAVDFEIEEARLGRGFGAGSAWNPDPAGLTGGGSMSW